MNKPAKRTGPVVVIDKDYALRGHASSIEQRLISRATSRVSPKDDRKFRCGVVRSSPDVEIQTVFTNCSIVVELLWAC